MAVRQLTHFRKLLFEKWMLLGSFVASVSYDLIGHSSYRVVIQAMI